MSRPWFFFAAILMVGITPAVGWADGWIELDPRAHPPHPQRHGGRPFPSRVAMQVTRHDVGITVDRGRAEVSVSETFHNPHRTAFEGTYYFPLPPGAQIEEFRATLGDRELSGEILPRDRAREIYERLIRRAVDPAILEYYDRGLFRARVSPIPAEGDVSLRITYRQTLRRTGAIHRLRYPLDTGRFAAGPYRNVRISATVRDEVPVLSVTSPSHPLRTRRVSDREFEVSFAADRLPAHRDFLLDIITTTSTLGGGVRWCRPVGEDGYFSLRLAPGLRPEAHREPVELILVMDTSGSMSGQKIEHARGALLHALDRLDPEDRFTIIAFESRLRHFAAGPTPATAENLHRAREFVQGLTARGGTNLHGALEVAVRAAQERSGGSTLVLVSDGAPTVGLTDPKAILRSIVKETGGDLRLHVFGVGKDVNSALLDDLARKNRGSRTYLRPQESLEIAFSSLLDKVLLPCLTGLRVTGQGVDVYALEPPGAQDLFHGEDLVIAGRFRHASRAPSLRIEGWQGTVRRSFVFPMEFDRDAGDDDAAYLWAENRVDRLLDELRLAGPPTRSALQAEIAALGLKFGIVTPLTSYLIQEERPGAVAEALNLRLRSSGRAKREQEEAVRGFAGRSGASAFDYARRKGAKDRAQRAEGKSVTALRPDEESVTRDAAGVRHAGGKAFIPVGRRLVAGNLQQEQLPPASIVLVYGSAGYFDYLRTNPGAARLLAAGRRLLFEWKGQIVRVDESPEPTGAAGRELF